MFNIFRSKANHFIGIDFGTSSIKVVELSYRDQRIQLENYGVVDLNWSHSSADGSPKITYEQKLNNALKTLLEKMKIDSGNSYISIPGFSGLITIIEFPEMSDEELANAIQFEAHKYIPSSLDEVAMSWEIIEKIGPKNAPEGTDDKTLKRLKVLLVAAPKKEIEHYDRLVSGLELDVKAIELETFSIARTLTDESGNAFIVDIGSRATNILLVEKGIVRVNRNIDAGGNEITSAIADGMDISRERAEIFKKGEKDLINNKESAIVIPVLELIVGESQRILNAYKEKNKEIKIEKMIISGGTSKMKGLEEFFSRSLGMQVETGNPWRKIAVDNKYLPLTKQLGGDFVVAIGLALRGVEDYKRK